MANDVQRLAKALRARPNSNGQCMAVARMVSDDQRKQAAEQGLFALASAFSGLENQAGYFARCAFRLARNSSNLLELGWPSTDGFMDWVNERLKSRGGRGDS